MNKKIIELLPTDADGNLVAEVLAKTANTVTVKTNSTEVPRIEILTSQLNVNSNFVIGSKIVLDSKGHFIMIQLPAKPAEPTKTSKTKTPMSFSKPQPSESL